MTDKKDTFDMIDQTPPRGGWWKWLLLLGAGAAVIVAVILFTRRSEEPTAAPVPTPKAEAATPAGQPGPPGEGAKPSEAAKAVAGETALPADKGTESAKAGVAAISEVVHFSTGSSSLTASEQAKLKSFIASLKGRTGSVLIEGHADAVGSDEYNDALSKSRADSVMASLGKLGLGQDWKVDLQWHGRNRPVADNDTPEGRSRNRRVELAAK